MIAAHIHPSALIDHRAQLDSSVSVGAYSIIGPNVSIAQGTTIGPHVVIEGHTRIGCNNTIYQFASIGAAPQDKKYAGEPTAFEIGDRNTIREFVTFNRGTVQDGGVTRLGNDNWIMAYVHIAHDCQVANHTILANCVQLAGHVHIDDWVILGGFTGVHQFCRIGAHAMLGMNTSLTQDVPPYMMVNGNPAEMRATNQEGLKRRGFNDDELRAVRDIHRTLYRKKLPLEDALNELKTQQLSHIVQPVIDFIALSTRGLLR